MISMLTMTAAGVNLYQGYKRQLARDMLYQETSAAMNRIVEAAKENTVDYEEYFNHLPVAQGGKGSTQYGEYYREYFHNFFYVAPTASDATCGLGLDDPARYNKPATDACHAQDLNQGVFSTKADNIANDDANLSALGGNNEQKELYLVSADGKQKFILKRIGNGIDDDHDGSIDEGDATDTGQEQIGLLTLQLKDQYNNATLIPGPAQGSPDGYYDCWANDPDYPERKFIPITPPTIEITNLNFFINPVDDPRKAFNEPGPNVQVHPSVTILLTARVARDVATRYHGEISPSTISLETTVSSRVYANVTTPFASDGTGGSGECLTPSEPEGGSCTIDARGKCTVCHKVGAGDLCPHSLTISPNDWATLAAHGDTDGACPPNTDPRCQ